ncbi:olfactomedin-4 [Echinops telfairi]|uniref:Olfactomedin-4 n=1 Tax=Echinops telfairi TaxID=9371 RepID=A0ABM0ZTT7_ECHTE|nr:olfactomedin-4 [Echinops telfairi]
MQLVTALLASLLLQFLVLPGQSQLVERMPGSVDQGGRCHCVVHLPSNAIPLQQLEKLQRTAQELIGKYEQELSRVSENPGIIDYHDNQALEMTYKLQSRSASASPAFYEAPAFKLLGLQLEGAQQLVTQLKAKGGVSGSENLLNQLQGQVANASFTLKLLGDSDKQSFRALHQEVDVLEGRLSECERDRKQGQTSSHRSPPLIPGSCAHGILQKVSRPLVVHLNWRGFSYKTGAWGRDSAPNSVSPLYWVAPLHRGGRYFDYYRLYKSFDDLVLLKNYEERKMGYGDGSGNAVYKNYMYFNYYGTGDMAKVDLTSNTLVLRRPLPGATYNNRFSYTGVPWKDIDFAGDEKGLWVLYATEESKGNLVVSRLNTSTLEVEKTWRTSQFKPTLSGAFMACGVLYALRSLSTRQEEIFYAFDTTTGQEHSLSITLDKMLETLQGINYCPSDHKLYVYNDGYLINYDLTFLTLQRQLPRTPVKRPFGVHAPPKPVKTNQPVTAFSP